MFEQTRRNKTRARRNGLTPTFWVEKLTHWLWLSLNQCALIQHYGCKFLKIFKLFYYAGNAIFPIVHHSCGKKVIVRDQYAFSFVNNDTLQRLYNTMVVILDRNTKDKPAKGITSWKFDLKIDKTSWIFAWTKVYWIKLMSDSIVFDPFTATSP